MRATEGSAIINDWKDKAKVVKCTNMHESNVVPVVTAAGLTKTMAPRTDATTETYEVDVPEIFGEIAIDVFQHFWKCINQQ